MVDQTNRLPENAQSFYASGVGIAATGTDIRLVFTDHHFPVDQDGMVGGDSEQRQCGIVSLSLHSAKDLHVMLGTALSDWEESFGEIDTPFLQSKRVESK